MLRSAVLATAGIWSLRVRTLDQAFQVIGLVPFNLAVICYTWDKADRQQLAESLSGGSLAVKSLCLAQGDDCSGTNLLIKVKEALRASVVEMAALVRHANDLPPMIR